MTRQRFGALSFAVLAAVLLATGCSSSSGGSARPAVCTDIDAIRSTAQSMKDVQIGEDAIGQIKADLAQIQGQLQTLKTDAKDQYATEIDGLTSSVSTLQAAIQGAESAPSAAALGTLTTAVGATVTAADTLVSAVSGTCS